MPDGTPDPAFNGTGWNECVFHPDAFNQIAGLAWQKKGIKPVKVNGVACEAKNISVEPLKYPLSRYIFIVLPTASPNPAVQKFVDWARTSPEAGEVINAAGGVAAFNKKAKK